MENTDKKNDMKKTLIICGSAVLVAAIALVCVITLSGGANSKADEGMDFIQGGEMTFEEFCFGMKEDLPQETIDEVKRLYEESKQAMKDGDMDKLDKIYGQLAELDVYDYSSMDTFDVSDGTASSDMDAVIDGDWED